MKRAAGIVATVAIILAAGWAGHRAQRFAARADDAVRVPAGEASAPLPSPATAGPEGPPQAGVAPPRSIPDQLPAFTLQNPEGRAMPVSTWQGKSLIVNFWATWCAPCRREMPLLQSLDRDWDARGFRVLGIAVDHPEAVRSFARSLQISYPLLVGDEDALDVAARLGVTSPVFPFTVFTDRRGQIVALYVGELHKAETDLILAAVVAVNQDQLAVAAARRQIAAGLAGRQSDSAAL